MPQYIKKPVVIEAFEFCTDNLPDWFMDAVSANKIILNVQKLGTNRYDGYCYIETLEGKMLATKGDYIIQGVKGEIYPCKADIFQMTYEAA